MPLALLRSRSARFDDEKLNQEVKIATLKSLSVHCKCEMVTFVLRIVAKIFIFQPVNFDYFLLKNDYL